MRITTVVLTTLGILIALALAGKWLSDASEMRDKVELVRAAGLSGELDSIVRGAYALLAAAIVGVVATIITLRGAGKVAALLLVAAVVVPALFTAKTLVATFLFALAVGPAYLAGRRSSASRG